MAASPSVMIEAAGITEWTWLLWSVRDICYMEWEEHKLILSPAPIMPIDAGSVWGQAEWKQRMHRSATHEPQPQHLHKCIWISCWVYEWMNGTNTCRKCSNLKSVVIVLFFMMMIIQRNLLNNSYFLKIISCLQTNTCTCVLQHMLIFTSFWWVNSTE